MGRLLESKGVVGDPMVGCTRAEMKEREDVWHLVAPACGLPLGTLCWWSLARDPPKEKGTVVQSGNHSSWAFTAHPILSLWVLTWQWGS